MDSRIHQPSAGGVEIEIVARASVPAGARSGQGALRRAVNETLSTAGVIDGHVAIALVSPDEIRRLNRDHRGRDGPTDALSFPIDERGTAGPRELGDVVICPEHTGDLARAAVHGVLHLLGYDHEADDGEMLALEDQIVAALR